MLDRALAKGTSHLSLYQLTIEPGTRFASMVAKHEFEPLDGDEAATLYELTAERTAEAGIPAYEISNYARAGAGEPPQPHLLAIRRLCRRRPRRPRPAARQAHRAASQAREFPLRRSRRNGHGLVEEEMLSAGEAADEALVMGLRLSEGIDPQALERKVRD